MLLSSWLKIVKSTVYMATYFPPISEFGIGHSPWRHLQSPLRTRTKRGGIRSVMKKVCSGINSKSSSIFVIDATFLNIFLRKEYIISTWWNRVSVSGVWASAHKRSKCQFTTTCHSVPIGAPVEYKLHAGNSKAIARWDNTHHRQTF